MPKTLITDIGEAKLALAAGDASAVEICEVALGDGLGASYEPSFEQTALRRELARREIDARHLVDPNAWRVKIEFPPDTPSFPVREMGFYSSDGDLISIWAGADIQPRQTGSIAYLVDHVLSFSRVAEGLLIVKAPDDVIFNMGVAQATTNFLIFTEQLRQGRAIHALQGGV